MDTKNNSYVFSLKRPEAAECSSNQVGERVKFPQAMLWETLAFKWHSRMKQTRIC